MTNNMYNIKQEYSWTSVYAPAEGIDKKLIILNTIMMIIVTYFAFAYFFNSETEAYGTAVLGASHTAEVLNEGEEMKLKKKNSVIQSEVSSSYSISKDDLN